MLSEKESVKSMELDSIKEACKLHVYHIPSDKDVPLHRHDSLDEIFYCIKGSGFGVLEDEEIELNVGDTFIAPAGVMHSLRSNEHLYVTALLVPVITGGN